MTQRGNGRRFLLESDGERRVYLDLLRENLAANKVQLVGYCLMSNHVHLIVVPQDAEGLPLSLKHTHGRYASYWNVAHHSNGHVWQGRYYSCPLDAPHLWQALRYTELNPVRAGLVTEARSWTWSSAVAHCGTDPEERFLNMELWQNHWTSADWQAYLAAGETDAALAAIRRSTHTGRPLGTQEFAQELEKSMHRKLIPQRGGRPPKPCTDTRQSNLHLG